MLFDWKPRSAIRTCYSRNMGERMQPDRVLWILPMVSLIPAESLIRLKKRFGKEFSKFNELEIQALVTADIEGFVDNARMKQITNCHSADITLLLQGLVSKQALIQRGQGRWTSYLLASSPDSVHKEISYSVHSGGDHSVHKSVSNEGKTLSQIAKHAKKKQRLNPEDMEKIILSLCSGRWLTRKQLGDLLNRNPDGLRARYLTQMVGHGLLQLRYPDKPNRADQAYTANAVSEANG